MQRYKKKYSEFTPEEKEYQKEASRKTYHKNKEKARETNKLWREKNKEYILTKQREKKRERKLEAIKYLGKVCKDCQGSFHPAVFEFHHRDESVKDRDPSKMLQLSWKRLQEELDKCDLLCANCHRIRHHGNKY